MTTRIVIYSTLNARPNYTPSFHREQPLGIPACGVPLRNPHRAIAVDDERLCASCWGGVSDAENPWDSSRIGDSNNGPIKTVERLTGPAPLTDCAESRMP